MRSTVLAFVLAVAVQAVFASDGTGSSVDCLSNGDVALVNVSPGRAAPSTFVELNTNAAYFVLCQVYYLDNANPKPTSIKDIRQTDTLVNLLLERYLVDVCRGVSPDELAEEYKRGEVFRGLVWDFPEWAKMMVAALYDAGAPDKPDLDITGVTMEAVGEFADRLAE